MNKLITLSLFNILLIISSNTFSMQPVRNNLARLTNSLNKKITTSFRNYFVKANDRFKSNLELINRTEKDLNELLEYHYPKTIKSHSKSSYDCKNKKLAKYTLLAMLIAGGYVGYQYYDENYDETEDVLEKNKTEDLPGYYKDSDGKIVYCRDFEEFALKEIEWIERRESRKKKLYEEAIKSTGKDPVAYSHDRQSFCRDVSTNDYDLILPKLKNIITISDCCKNRRVRERAVEVLKFVEMILPKYKEMVLENERYWELYRLKSKREAEFIELIDKKSK